MLSTQVLHFKTPALLWHLSPPLLDRVEQLGIQHCQGCTSKWASTVRHVVMHCTDGSTGGQEGSTWPLAELAE